MEKIKIGDKVRIYDDGIGTVVDVINDNEIEVELTVYERLPIDSVELIKEK